MSLFSLFKKKAAFSKEENDKIVQAIRDAEMQTSGEIRVYVESKCKFIDPIDRAKEIFAQLQMENTSQRNAVLLYIAIKDRQLAIYADAGIHEKVGEEYWKEAVNKMLFHFTKKDYVEGISICVQKIGEALKQFFPYDGTIDKNELPDDIVFGK
jgi:uncharacterized membrane protein